MSTILQKALDQKARAGFSRVLYDELNMKFPDNVDHKTRVIALVTFGKLTDLMGVMGWQEHTSDWDPYFVIELMNGEQLETISGYHELEVKDYTDDLTICCDHEVLQIVRICNIECGQDWDGEQWTEFKIDDIKSIRIQG